MIRVNIYIIPPTIIRAGGYDRERPHFRFLLRMIFLKTLRSEIISLLSILVVDWLHALLVGSICFKVRAVTDLVTGLQNPYFRAHHPVEHLQPNPRAIYILYLAQVIQDIGIDFFNI